MLAPWCVLSGVNLVLTEMIANLVPHLCGKFGDTLRETLRVGVDFAVWARTGLGWYRFWDGRTTNDLK
jgi:hypothetical protein